MGGNMTFSQQPTLTFASSGDKMHTGPNGDVRSDQQGVLGTLIASLGGLVPGGEMTRNTSTGFGDDETEDVPLLEELGIKVDHVAARMRSALLFYRVDHDLLADCDLTGPLVLALCLGMCLLLRGKVHFGYIYGLGITGCAAAYILLNLMNSQGESIDMYRTMSILGYGLLPVVILAAISLIITLRSLVGTVLCVCAVLWGTSTASRFFETALRMEHQRFLVAYPIALLYACFVIITVF